ncbi:DGQHR domain-containing protein [Bradyrhizobium sp. cir1]|uniref:DGQHR domain-containing protein n=1 Tax=Bradyrhizobium sp. cir1 TaxID=1445730 RepID=UPI0016061B4A|nr:DGQHR domain-containing protein [Bradyrhizobium sp. cir1]MBB4370180.1 DGQHR domain-containing protein [Bradyrhizobium sp. cir1]
MIDRKSKTNAQELRIGAVEVKQPIGSFYLGSVNAYDLLEICKFDFRRIDESGGFKEFLGFQRKLDLKRVKEIEQYIQTVDAVFPTAIVISVDDRCASFEKSNNLVLRPYVDSEDDDLRIDYADIASIIDGQHRLKAFENVKDLDFDLSVAVFIGVDEATKAEIFSTVNLTQTKVNKSLVYDLFALRKARSPEKTCHEIVVALDSLKRSPFEGKIKRLGTATEGRFGETLSQATIVRGLLPYITNDPLNDRDVGKRVGFWDPISPEQHNKRIFYEFFRNNEDEKILANVLNYFSAVHDRWPDAWESTGRGNILTRTNGFNGLIRFFRPAYLYFTTQPKVISKDRYSSLFAKVKLSDEDFNTDNFPPGGSGSTKLYRTLLEQSRIDRD